MSESCFPLSIDWPVCAMKAHFPIHHPHRYPLHRKTERQCACSSKPMRGSSRPAPPVDAEKRLHFLSMCVRWSALAPPTISFLLRGLCMHTRRWMRTGANVPVEPETDGRETKQRKRFPGFCSVHPVGGDSYFTL